VVAKNRGSTLWGAWVPWKASHSVSVQLQACYIQEVLGWPLVEFDKIWQMTGPWSNLLGLASHKNTGQFWQDHSLMTFWKDKNGITYHGLSKHEFFGFQVNQCLWRMSRTHTMMNGVASLSSHQIWGWSTIYIYTTWSLIYEFLEIHSLLSGSTRLSVRQKNKLTRGLNRPLFIKRLLSTCLPPWSLVVISPLMYSLVKILLPWLWIPYWGCWGGSGQG